MTARMRQLGGDTNKNHFMRGYAVRTLEAGKSNALRGLEED